jgi:hypothetical protein
MAGDLGERHTVVAIEDGSPGAVAETGRSGGRVDDVGEHERHQLSLRRRARRRPEQEVLDVVDDRVAVARPPVVVGTVQLDELGIGNLLGEPTRTADRPPGVGAPVDEDRRAVDRRCDVSDVEAAQRPHQAQPHLR